MSLRSSLINKLSFPSVIIALLFISFFTSTCKKIDYKRVVKVVTLEASEPTATSIEVRGDILDLGEDPISKHGICWSDHPSPGLSNKVIDLKEPQFTGIFSATISDLEPAITYYYRAFVQVGDEPVYGEVFNFTTLNGIIEIETTDVTEVTASSFVIGAHIASDGGAEVTARGFCWSTSPDPTVETNPVSEGAGLGNFNTQLSELEMNTTYYVRAYATNEIDTKYGNPVEVTLWFNEPGPNVTDVDGNLYNSKRIGTQVWMAQNLKTTKFNNSEPIPQGTNHAAWTSLSEPAYAWYDNNSNYKNVYGALYNWHTVSAGNLCPSGWHVPEADEYQVLEDYLVSTELAGSEVGGMMKEQGLGHWATPNTLATNQSGFTGLPAGIRGANPGDPGDFYIAYRLFLWTATSGMNNFSYARTLSNSSAEFSEAEYDRTLGASVRCVKD